MKDIYSPLEIDEEWDNYAPTADGSSTALMERAAGVSTDGPTEGNGLDTEAATTTTVPVTPDVMPDSRVMPGINDLPGDGTKEPDQSSITYDTAEALIDKPTTNTDTFDISDTNSSPTPDPSGLVSITPGGLTPEPTSGETTPGETNPETTIAGTPHEMIPVNVNVTGGEAAVTGGETTDSNDTLPDPNFMGGEAADSGDKLPEVVDQSKGGTSSPDVRVVPSEEPKEETDEQTDEGDSDVVIDTGTITPDTGEESTDTIKASDDDGESSSDDDTESAEADTSSTDSDDKSSETKADNAKAPTNPDDDELAGILDKWDQSNKEIADMLKAARKDIEANVLRMSDQKTNLKTDLEQQIADLDEGIANENARLAKIETNLAKLPSDEAN